MATVTPTELKQLMTRLERLERLILPQGDGEIGRDYIARRNAGAALLAKKIEQREGKK